MKKTIYTLSILLGVLVSAQKNVEVKVSYGTASLYGISESITANAFNAFNFLGPGNKIVTYESAGVFAVDVMIQSENSRWKYGLGYGHETVKDSNLKFEGNFNTILAQGNYTWLSTASKLKMYSGAGIGASFLSFKESTLDESSTIFAFNVSPIGISYGEKFGVFLETNLGTKGLLQGGVSYTF
ncbi:hypothetical protein [Kaistella jeonii]|uniref:Outer membrane protein beta-barrel domain-containing protein n=1 Tax=Kaistella jeonii TaxID=266749 RepID=A0A0C1CX18_9FLAO|nr:hypothetical protein [Kaistella jeonii]KIA85985.1 hypothetical protein OA86_14285 [Kaistella jeonii]SFC38098.1 hypothetical protein SAMN05421876_11719 [Kaistella jeonii]VEI96830.1 Uncharacterised protein [Kaistella jeonii]